MMEESLTALRRGFAALALLAVAHASWAGDTTANTQLSHWSSVAGVAGSVERGRMFFGSRHRNESSCASCHGALPTGPGKHAATGKVLPPLAPAANPKAFTDSARVDKWFRRNCNDVVGRECSAMEKADILAFLLSLRP